MIKIFNPSYRDRIEKFLERQYFMKHIGFKLNLIEEGRTEGYLDLAQIHQQQKGMVHGGVIATVADITMGFAAYSGVPLDAHVVTGDLKVSYLNPGMGDRLLAKGWILKQGKKINFCESEVWSYTGNEGKLIAKASASMVTIYPDEIINK
ncbi:MAG: PaaI family thioesterase [Candidatus Cyclobacteriaceae bacterium M2_1C_046]